MTFLAPLWLLAAAVGGIVLLLHATRRREVAVPSLQLWRRLDAGSARRKVRRRPPLTPSLLLQLLAVLLAALALAQPRIGSPAPREIVFVIDGSGSMRTADASGTTRFAAARADLVAAISGIGADGDVRVSVVRAGADPVLVAARQTRPAGLVPLVEALRPGDDAVDWPATFAALAPLLPADGAARVVVLTDDGAAAGAAVPQTGATVEIVRHGDPATPDVALAARLVAIDPAAGRWRVEGTVTASGGAAVPAEVAVALAPGAVGGLLDWQPIAVRAPRASADGEASPLVAPFGGELNLPGAGRLRLSLAADAAPHDDAVFFTVLGSPQALRVVFVGPPDRNLVRALESVGPVTVQTAERVPDDLTGIDLVVVTTAIDERPATNVLWLAGGRIAGESVPVPLAASDPTAWNASHPLSRNVDWATLEGPPALGVETLPGAEIILAAGDAPLVQARTTAAGREVRLALDLAAPGFADTPAFPVFVANLVAWLGPDFGRATGSQCTAGMPCPLAARDLAAQVVAPDGSIAWRGAAGRGPLPRGFDAAFVPMAAGFYTATRADGTVSAIAVNAAADGNAVTGPAGGTLPAAPIHLAPWLAAAAFIALLAEALIAGRGAEQFLRRAAIRRGAPGAGRRRAIVALRGATLAAILAAVLAAPLPAREPAEAVFAVTAAAGGGATTAAAAFADEAARLAADGRVDVIPAATGDGGRGVDIESAIRLAAAMLPADRAGRIVVAADGNETAGAVGAAVPELLARSLPLDFEPLAAMPPGEVLVARVEAGRNVRAGDSVPLTALIYAASPGPAALDIVRDGIAVATRTVALDAGWNRVDTVVPEVEGRTLVEVAISAPGDAEPGNNRDGAVIAPRAAPRVLVVSPDREWGAFFASAIDAQGIASEVIPPDRAPRDLAGWLAFDVVVLMNVPALALTTAQQELLDDAAGVHGRGLVILGGENAFGPGGYYATPLERLSPLSSRVPQEAPRAAIVFVLDRSGSMQAPVDDVTRLDIARGATLGAVALLPAESEVGIVAFDSEARVVVPMQSAADGAAVAAALAPLAPGGGTELFPAISEAFGLLRDSTAETRHIVVITDGLVEPVDFTGLIDEIVAAGITVSTVAVGTSAITDKLERIAADGGGAYHATADFKALPGILAEEAMFLATSPVMVGSRPVAAVDWRADFIGNLPPDFPPVEAVIATTAKPGAELHLATVDDSGAPLPLLASWRYGIGRVLAFATHGAGPGTLRWLDAPQYALLWAQAVRAFLPGIAGPGLHVFLDRDGDVVRIAAQLVGDDGQPEDGAKLVADIGEAAPLPLVPAGDGRHLGVFAATEGTHAVSITGDGVAAVAAIHVGYPAALDFTRAGPGDLGAASTLSGGERVDAIAALHTGDAWRLRPSWRPWLLLALALLVGDLALRQAGWPLRRRSRLAGEPVAEPGPEIPGLRRALRP